MSKNTSKCCFGYIAATTLILTALVIGIKVANAQDNITNITESINAMNAIESINNYASIVAVPESPTLCSPMAESSDGTNMCYVTLTYWSNDGSSGNYQVSYYLTPATEQNTYSVAIPYTVNPWQCPPVTPTPTTCIASIRPSEQHYFLNMQVYFTLTYTQINPGPYLKYAAVSNPLALSGS